MDRQALGTKARIGAKTDPSALRYRDLLLIRRTEEAVGQLYALGYIAEAVQLSIGREALFAGLVDGRAPRDPVVIGRRCHGLLLALGLPVDTLLEALTQSSAGRHSRQPNSELAKFCDAKLVQLVDGEPDDVFRHGLDQLARAARNSDEGAVVSVVIDCAAAPPSGFHDLIADATSPKKPLVILLDVATPGSSAMGQGERAWMTPFEAAGLTVRTIEGFDRDLVAAAVKTARNDSWSTKQPTVLAISTEAFRGHAFAAFHGSADPGMRRSGFDPVARVRARAITAHQSGEETAAEIEAEIRAEVAQATKAIRDREKDRS